MAAISSTGTGAWNTNAVWVGGVQPTAADDVTIVAGSNITVPGATTVFARSVTVAATGTLTWNNSATAELDVGDAGGGLFNNAGIIALGATAGILKFVSTQAATLALTSGGATMPNITISTGASTTIQMADALTANGTIELVKGAFDTNSKAFTWQQGVRSDRATGNCTLSLGTSVGSITGNISGTSTSMTFSVGFTTISPGTSSITNSAGSNSTMSLGAKTFYDLIVTGAGSPIISSVNTFHNLTRTGTNVKTDGLSLSASQIVTNTLTLGGNTTQGANRLLVLSGTIGTQRTFTVGAVVINGDVDFTDIAITYSGSTSWTNAGSAYIGDALGNNSTITTNATAAGTFYYKSAANANWSTVGNWFTATNGGGSAGRVPLPQDTVFIDANSGANTKTADMPRLGGSIDFTGFTGTLALSINVTLFGNLTMVSGMTISGAFSVFLAGRGSQTLTSGGKQFPSGLQINAAGGSYTLQDALATSGFLTHNNGTFSTANFSVSIGGLTSSASTTRVLSLGTSTVSLTATTATTVWTATTIGSTINASAAVIVLSTASANNRTFAGGGFTYGTLTYTAANSPGPLTITGVNTFNSINVGSGRIFTMPASTTSTFNNSFNVNGTNNGYEYLPGVSGNYVSTPDTAALSITGDIDIQVNAALDSWTPATDNQLLAKRDGSGAQASYGLLITLTSGKPALKISTDGVTVFAVTASVAPTVSNGSQLWLRAARVASTGTVTFYTSTDPATTALASISWTQLGVPVTATTGNIFDSTSVVEIGSESVGTSRVAAGKFYRAAVLNGIGGTVALDANFTTKAFGANTFTESSANAATMTINGTLAQAGDGRVALQSSTAASPATMTTSGNNVIDVDYLVIQDTTVTGGNGWFAGPNSVNVSGNSGPPNWTFGASGEYASDTITTSESVGYYSDLIASRESLQLLLDANPRVSDTLTTSESLKLLVESSINKSDTITTSENVNQTLVSLVNLSDTLTTAEAVQVSIPLLITVSDTLTTSESLKLLSEANVNKSDTITTSESVNRTLVSLVSTSDTLTTSESVGKLLTSLVNKSDTITTSEAVSLLTTQNINKSDTLTFTESVSLQIADIEVLSDTLTFTESVKLLISINTSRSDTLTLSESVQLLIYQIPDAIDIILSSFANTDTMESETNIAVLSSGANTDTLTSGTNQTTLETNSSTVTLNSQDNDVTLG